MPHGQKRDSEVRRKSNQARRVASASQWLQRRSEVMTPTHRHTESRKHNATQRNATLRNATQRNATQRSPARELLRYAVLAVSNIRFGIGPKQKINPTKESRGSVLSACLLVCYISGTLAQNWIMCSRCRVRCPILVAKGGETRCRTIEAVMHHSRH